MEVDVPDPATVIDLGHHSQQWKIIELDIHWHHQIQLEHTALISYRLGELIHDSVWGRQV